MSLREHLIAAVIFLSVAGAVAPTASAQRGRTPSPPNIPALSMTCPMHPDIVESSPGTCPLCKMKLIPVRLDSAWMCPVHSVVTESEPGKCRICGRDLIQVTVALTWACRNEVNVDHLEPGLCSDGTPRITKRTLRPHGNHNAQHGGQFFMAPDNWHHLEGTYPSERVFQLYLYDDYARLLPANKLKRVQARVVTQEAFDPNTRKTAEITAFPLRVSRNGAHLEARVNAASLPAAMTAKVRLKPDGPEYRFDFTFPALTKDLNPVASVMRASRGAASSSSARSAPTTSVPAGPTPDPSPASAVSTDSGLVTLPIPETVPEILAQLRARDRQIGELVTRGDFGSVWVPAFQAKDLAVALETHLVHVTATTRDAGEPALKDVVRTAWLLDAVGDLGNRQQIEDAYSTFTAAVSQVLTAFSGTQ